MNNIDPQWKKLFDRIGVTEKELQDKETSQFIYDFVESHGGIEKATKELDRSGTPSSGRVIIFFENVFKICTNIQCERVVEILLRLPLFSQLNDVQMAVTVLIDPTEIRHCHCVKSAQILSFSGPHFSVFGLNTEIYGVFSPKAGKYGQG